MDNSSSILPGGSEDLRERVRELARERDLAYEALKVKTLEVEKLKMQLAKLRRMQFGQSSEKLSHQVAQLELAIEEAAADLDALAEPIVEAAPAPAEPAPPAELPPRTASRVASLSRQ